MCSNIVGVKDEEKRSEISFIGLLKECKIKSVRIV